MLQNKNYSKKKYQFGIGSNNDDLNTLYKDLKNNSVSYNDSKQRDFMTWWTSSKRGKKLLKKSTDDTNLSEKERKDNYNTIYTNRMNNPLKSKTYLSDTEKFQNMQRYFGVDGSNVAATTTLKNQDPEIFLTPGVFDKESTSVHELSHVQDKGGEYIPEKDIKLMNKYKRPDKYFYNAYRNSNLINLSLPEDKENIDYLSSPTETRARLNAIRYEMYRDGVVDVMNKKIKSRHLNEYNRNIKLSPESTEKGYKTMDDILINPFIQLRSVYPDKKIKRMLNKISDNNTPTYNNYAKYGGEIIFKNYSKFNK